VALIGEYTRNSSLAKKLRKMRYYFRSVAVFTETNLFTEEMGEKYDILIGCRPCNAEKIILSSAERFNKKFIMMPCSCAETHFKNKIPDAHVFNKHGPKIVNYIRENLQITGVEICVDKTTSLTGFVVYRV